VDQGAVYNVPLTHNPIVEIPDVLRLWHDFLENLLTFDLEDNQLSMWMLMMPNALAVHALCVSRFTSENELPEEPHNPLDLRIEQA